MAVIGSIVVIYHKPKKEEIECFVEDIVTKSWTPSELKIQKRGHNLSLYSLIGDYIGDYWESELKEQKKNEYIEMSTLTSLITKSLQKKDYRSAKDFVRVLGILIDKKWK